ncbi:MAG TPA: DUF3618 domain-containing protein [Thermoanaerobaculia bacterium]|jgi:hypothetical protein
MAQTEDFVTTTGSTSASANTDLGAGSGRSSREIQSEIDRTRADLDETFAALDAKLTPGQIGLELWHLFKGGSSAGAGKLWRIAREHPMPAAVIGLGLGWLLVESSRSDDDRRAQDYGSYRTGYAGDYGYGRSSYAGTDYATDFEATDFDTEESGGRLSAAKDKVKDVAGSAKDAVIGAKDKVGEAAEWTKDHALDLGHRTKDRASELRYRAQDKASALKGQAKVQARRAKLGFWQTLEENPLMVGAATLALGVIAGLSIPSTEKEKELMGETRDRLLEEVKEAGQQALEKGKHVAEAVAGTVKEEVKNAGLTPEGVAEKVRNVAREAAQTAKEEAKKENLTAEAATNRAKQAAENVRDTAKAETHEHEPELVKR